jgi:GcrA cell cycle regulator
MKTFENRDGWTAERDDALRKLWDEGLTGTQIAQRMRTTRNSILARARRIHLPFRISAESKAFTKPRPKANATKFNFSAQFNPPPKATPAPEPFVSRETVVAPAAQHIPFEALEAFDRRCRYPHGDAHPYTFCGLPTALGTSWCVHHLKAISPPLGAKIDAAMAGEVFRDPTKNPEPQLSNAIGQLEAVE